MSNKSKTKKMTAKQVEEAQNIVSEKRRASIVCDALQAQFDEKKREFERQNADLISLLDDWRSKWNALAIELIEYERLGFREHFDASVNHG